MRVSRVTVIVAAAVLLMLPMHASAEDYYAISMRLSHAGEVFASPRLTVVAGAESSIESLGDNGYALALVAKNWDDGTIKIETRLKSSFGDMQLTIVTRNGQPARISNGGIEIEFLAMKVKS